MRTTQSGNVVSRVSQFAIAAMCGLPLVSQTAFAADPASWATMATNPQDSCNAADTNKEAKRCTLKNVCVANESGAVLEVLISTLGRTADAGVQTIAVGQTACRNVWLHNQTGAAIGIFRVKAMNASFSYRSVSMPSTITAGMWTAVDYQKASYVSAGKTLYPLTGNWPGGGLDATKPAFADEAKGTWKFTVYGRVLLAFNFCGSNNSYESSTTPVKACVWSVS